MTKKEIAKAVADRLGTTDLAGLAAVQATLDAMGEALAAGRRIELRGFGVFESRVRPARRGRNMHTGEWVAIPAARVVKFRASGDIGSRAT